MDIRSIPLEQIWVGKRLRTLKPARIKELAESIDIIGLQAPITVVPGKFGDGGVLVDGFQLVAGNHRFEAHKMLGRSEIMANVVSLDDLKRELWEIDENLRRAELTKLEFGEHTRRRTDVVRAIQEAEGTDSFKGNRFTGSVVTLENRVTTAIRDTAEKADKSESYVWAALRWSDKIVPDVKLLIAETEIADSYSDLCSLASMTEDDQFKTVKMVLAGKAETVREARAKLHRTVTVSTETEEDRAIRQIEALFAKLSDEGKERVRALVGANKGTPLSSPPIPPPIIPPPNHNLSIRANPKDRGFVADFAVWYGRYPKKVGRPVAFKSYVKARRNGATAEQILTGLETYLRTKPEYADWCNPATWLNQERWSDEPTEAATVSASTQASSAPAAAGSGKADDNWRAAMRLYAKNPKSWVKNHDGPPPTDPRTRVPEHILAEFGFAKDAA